VIVPAISFAGHHEAGETVVHENAEDVVWGSGGRAIAAEVEGEVVAVDLGARQLVVRGPGGNSVTLSAREDGVDISQVVPGDTIIADYVASIEAEVRQPIAEELAEPWVVIGEQGNMGAETVSPQRVWRAWCVPCAPSKQWRAQAMSPSKMRVADCTQSAASSLISWITCA